MAPFTQLGKVIFPEVVDKHENRFNNEYFNRSVWFMEDLISHDRLNFCKRYLQLAGYEEMFNDIIKFFTTIKRPYAGLRSYDTLTNLRVMCNIVPHTGNREMVRIIDNTQPRIMCINRGARPAYRRD